MGAAVRERTIGVALLGAGTVGSQVARLLLNETDELTARVGARLELIGVAVRRPHRHADIPAELITTDSAALVADPRVEIVIEVIGGIEPARTLLLSALRRGARVVTANKALLAEDGPALFEAADASGSDVSFEAAVAGAIPLIRPIRESLAGDRITRIMGIVNGTTNYILSAMSHTGVTYEQALAEATRLGYAEADPTADVDGFDAAAKASILASVGFHTRVRASDVYREGIADVSSADVSAAAEIGYVIKPLAICERVTTSSGDAVSVRTHPMMLPRTHPLASVDGAYNAVYVEAENAGKLMFYGPGAGGAPTASAVLGDVVTAARNLVVGGRGPAESAHANLAVQPMGQVPTRYHICLDVADRPGVLASVANAFAEEGVSISTVRQEGGDSEVTLVLVTHVAPDAALAHTVQRLGDLPAVRKVTSVMRVAEEQ
ncbi:MAG: homoserine dehydrogenase [Nakamurella sp.]